MIVTTSAWQSQSCRHPSHNTHHPSPASAPGSKHEDRCCLLHPDLQSGRGTPRDKVVRLVEILHDTEGAAIVEAPLDHLWRQSNGRLLAFAVDQEELAAKFERRGNQIEKRVQPLARNMRQPEGAANAVVALVGLSGEEIGQDVADPLIAVAGAVEREHLRGDVDRGDVCRRAQQPLRPDAAAGRQFQDVPAHVEAV